MSISTLQPKLDRAFDVNDAHPRRINETYVFASLASFNGTPPKRTVLGEVRGRRKTFPLALHKMLESAEMNGTSEIASWQPHGRAFRIHKSKEFEKTLMPKLFRQTKWSSFQRQLNLYGFRRITTDGPDKGSYYHVLFVRGDTKLANSIQRTKIKGTLTRVRAIPEIQPDFYACAPLDEKANSIYSCEHKDNTNTNKTRTSNNRFKTNTRIEKEVLGKAMHKALSGFDAFADEKNTISNNSSNNNNNCEHAGLQGKLEPSKKRGSNCSGYQRRIIATTNVCLDTNIPDEECNTLTNTILSRTTNKSSLSGNQFFLHESTTTSLANNNENVARFINSSEQCETGDPVYNIKENGKQEALTPSRTLQPTAGVIQEQKPFFTIPQESNDAIPENKNMEPFAVDIIPIAVNDDFTDAINEEDRILDLSYMTTLSDEEYIEYMNHCILFDSCKD